MQHSRRFVKGLMIVVLSVGILSCGTSDYNNPIPVSDNSSQATGPNYNYSAKGTIAGEDWNFVQGRASVFQRNGHSYLDIRLWNTPFADPCGELNGSTQQIRLYAEYSQGSWVIDPSDPFALIPTVIFADLSQTLSSTRSNMVASVGKIDVTSVTSEGVVGDIQASFPSAIIDTTSITGNFSVVFCGP